MQTVRLSSLAALEQLTKNTMRKTNILENSKHTKKEISFAYKSSTLAEKYKLENGGYIVSIGAFNKMRDCAGFNWFNDAARFADSMPYELSKYSLTHA